MKVSTNEPFQIIYSIYLHEYLGYLFESFVVQLNSEGKYTFKHQNISRKNAAEFSERLDEIDFKLIKLIDAIQQDSVAHKFDPKKMNPNQFFLKIYDKEKGDKTVQELISEYVDRNKAEILSLLQGKEVFIMGNDGEPTWKKVTISDQKASMLFHFFKNEDNTHYFPTIKHKGEKIAFQYNNSQVLCINPAWLLVEEKTLLSFDKNIDGNKIKPFLNKNFIVIPKKVEETYYNNFISQIVAQFDVHAKGFDIILEKSDPKTILSFKDLVSTQSTLGFFDQSDEAVSVEEENKLVFDLSFKYGTYVFSAGSTGMKNSVKLEKVGDSYLFHKVVRNPDWEYSIWNALKSLGLELRNGKLTMPKVKAFDWVIRNGEALEELGIEINQDVAGNQRKYFLGKSTINIEIRENNDWFDIYAVVRFGKYEIPFIQLKDIILAGRTEFFLPSGEIAVIPEEWVTQYSELFAFSELNSESNQFRLKKHHIALVQELENDSSLKISLNKKLLQLQQFDQIEEYDMPIGFKGSLRPYQKAGYNWLRFLNSYNFGGCLADDMGLGKTIQTLAMLQFEKEKNPNTTSLLIMPTTLVYNWEQEARKFTPDLKILVYTGTYRDKNTSKFSEYDVIITSYGIVRIDTDLLKNFYFHYVILDESQSIKNPTSNIAQAVNQLKSTHRLVLTGTPIENSTMDLWSQMSFINPGLLGTQQFFKRNFLNAIEKKNDPEKKKKLYTIIKPFILRRQKSQVLTELPDKVEQILYCKMSEEQEKEYEETKSYFRNKILEEIDEKGLGKTQITILQGLTKLRQIANHPRLVNEEYKGGSGKLDEVKEILQNAISDDHKILIFSQFVKHLSIIREYFDKEKIDYAYLDGSTKARQSQVELFQNKEDIRIFLISLKAGGLGLNLTAADYVFILDPWWNPAIEAQAVDRAYRMGQKNTVFTYKFITQNTVEEKILKLQANKKQLASELISIEESFVKSLSKEDIQDLLA